MYTEYVFIHPGHSLNVCTWSLSGESVHGGSVNCGARAWSAVQGTGRVGSQVRCVGSSAERFTISFCAHHERKSCTCDYVDVFQVFRVLNFPVQYGPAVALKLHGRSMVAIVNKSIQGADWLLDTRNNNG